MKTFSVLALGVLALCTLDSAAAVPKYAGAADWKQYLPAQKRAVLSDAEDDSQQSIEADGTAEHPSPEQLPLKLSPNPMSPFLSIRPFLPVKPTFVPPFVDPQIFIDKKTALLNNLFSGSATGPANVATPKAVFWPPPASPNYFAQKKTQFLNTLFSNLAAQSTAPAGAQEVKRDLSGSDLASLKPNQSLESSAPVVDPNIFIDKKTIFLKKLFAALNLPDDDEETEGDNAVTVKPTIVPPNFWSPFTPSQTGGPQPVLSRVPLTKTAPAVDPTFFVDKKTKFLNTLFDSLALPPKPFGIPPTKAPIVPANFWIPPGKPDPATMYKQKVSEFLDKLFKSLNTTVSPDSVSTRDVESLVSEDGEVQQKASGSDSISVKPRFIGGPGGIWGPPALAPTVDPKFFIDKKTDFLNKLFSSLSVPAGSEEANLVDDPTIVKPTIVPPNFWSPFAFGAANAVDDSTVVKPTIVPPNFWSPFASGAANVVDDSAIVKPTIVPPNFWSPFATTAGKGIKSSPFSPVAKPAPIVDPTFFVNKKTQFLDNLFNSLGLPPKTAATSPVKPAPNAEPSIDTTGIYNSQLAEFLERVFNAVDSTDDIEKRSNDDRIKNEELSDLVSDETQGITDNLARRTLPVVEGGYSEQTDPLSNPLLVAKDKVVSSIITELGGIKNEMMDTLAEIMKQQKEAAAAAEAAAATPATPFGMMSPFAFGAGKMGGPMYGAGKMSGPMYGAMYGAGKKGSPTGKKGDTTATDGKKKTGPPFGGKFPFWAPTPAPKPTPDPTIPLQKRLEFLNQVFEMLTKLQKDVTSAVNQAASDSIPPVAPTPTTDEANFLNLIKQMIKQGGNSTTSTKGSKSKLARQKITRGLELEPNSSPIIPDLWTSKAETEKDEEDSKTRSIKMAVHQGYQSLPPGTEELIQTGGGSEIDNQEGGGLRLQDGDSDEVQEDKSERHQHHHHNHH